MSGRLFEDGGPRKRCPKCSTAKLLGEFYSPDAGYCKECSKRGVREWNKANPGANRAYSVKKLYGVAARDLQAMIAAQGDACAVCGGRNRGNKSLGVDHDHATGAVRGLLCDSCNSGLGRFRDNPDLLIAAAWYLRRHKGQGRVA